MKICYVVPWFPSMDIKTPESQQGIFEYRNVSRLSERGNKFKIITIKWKGQSNYEKIDENIEVHRIPHYFSLVRYPLPHFNKLNQKIKEINEKWVPDLMVYSHMIYLTTMPIFVNKTEKPVIVTTDCIPGINWHFGNKIVDLTGLLYSKTIGKMIFHKADGIHLLSSFNTTTLQKWKIDTTKTYVVPRGVNTKSFKPKKGEKLLKENLKIKNDETVVLFVGRLDLVKGIDYLIKAATKITSDYKKVKFLIVGEGSLKPKYEKISKEISDRIIFLGYRTDIPSLMNISNIFVLTSLSEGACNVVLEASASGLPVIATGVGEVQEIISDRETGILTQPRNVNQLIKSLKTLIENPNLAQKMGEKGRKRIENKYDEKIIYDKIEQHYNSTIEEFSRQKFQNKNWLIRSLKKSIQNIFSQRNLKNTPKEK